MRVQSSSSPYIVTISNILLGRVVTIMILFNFYLRPFFWLDRIDYIQQLADNFDFRDKLTIILSSKSQSMLKKTFKYLFLNLASAFKNDLFVSICELSKMLHGWNFLFTRYRTHYTRLCCKPSKTTLSQPVTSQFKGVSFIVMWKYLLQRLNVRCDHQYPSQVWSC